MFVAITNTPRDYAWGSTTAIPSLLGTEPTGAPQAELWLGTHPGSPSQVVGDGSLAELTTLPFLLKVLAASSPLSLQAHPTSAQAAEGFARENAAGIPLDDPARNYKDDRPKPELIVALSPMRALCGFRSVSESRAALERLIAAAPGDPALNAWLDRLGDDLDIGAVFAWLIEGGPSIDELLESLVAAAALVDGPHYAVVGELAATFPGDPGIAISLMLNLVELLPGEALFLAAGNIHAYLEGVGVELMAASDNVLRGGLTAKHVDVAELLRVLDFAPVAPPVLEPRLIADGVWRFSPGVPDFELTRVTANATLELPAEAVVLCTAGEFALSGALGPASVSRGQALYVSADESRLGITGAGELFVATAAP